MKLRNLKDLLLDQLKDLYSAEEQLIKALPKMAKASTSPELREAFQNHLGETEGQLKRLKEVFTKLGSRAEAKLCKAMEGLIKEGDEILKQKGSANPAVLDAGLIAAAQKVEHYEIGSYGTARSFAKLLGEDEAAELLQETLDEEGEADKTLTTIAENSINIEAAEGDSDDGEEEEEGEESEEEEEKAAPSSAASRKKR